MDKRIIYRLKRTKTFIGYYNKTTYVYLVIYKRRSSLYNVILCHVLILAGYFWWLRDFDTFNTVFMRLWLNGLKLVYVVITLVDA